MGGLKLKWGTRRELLAGDPMQSAITSARPAHSNPTLANAVPPLLAKGIDQQRPRREAEQHDWLSSSAMSNRSRQHINTQLSTILTTMSSNRAQQTPLAYQPRQTPRRSMSGLSIRHRASKALNAGVSALTTTSNEGDAASSSRARLGQTFVHRSASFASLAGQSSDDGASTRSAPRSRLTDIRGKARQSSLASTLSSSTMTEEEREATYRKHNLVPLPPPGHVRPILLPTYATKSSEGDFSIRLDGFVELWPKSIGTSQRVFNQMVRQMANLPRLPRQQPTPASAASNPWSSKTSSSMPSSPLHEDTDDAMFFPDVPYGVPRSAKTDEMRTHDGVEELGITERITQQAFAFGAPDKAISKVMQTVGALPVEGKLDKEWEDRVEKEAAEEAKEEAKLHENETNQPGRQGPLGGSSFWASRTKDDVERLWHTLEHRLRSFWTYRKPHQQVIIEIVPVFQGEESQQDQEWSLDEHEQNPGRDASNLAPLLAVTKLVSDANGLFSTDITVTKDKALHYIGHYHTTSPKSISDLLFLRVRACMLVEDGQMVRSQWQSLHVTPDDPTSVRIVCDIDDTAKFTDILAGSRAVTRNVFVRPFEEVEIAGVAQWFDSLVHEAGVDGFHFVTNAPAEMYGIVKAYLSSAQLPTGHLALKHYFSPTRTASWLQTFLQPAASRKRQNLQRCLDDFPASKFIFIGDSGEMDLEIYSELAKERPNQIRGIFIRDVGNVTAMAKSMANGSFAKSIPSSIQAPPAAHLQSQTRAPLEAKPSAAKRSTEVLRKASMNTSNAPINEYEARLGRALAQLSPSTRLRFWSSGQDAMQESISYIKELKSATPAS